MGVNAMQVSAGEALATLRAGWTAQAAGQMTASWMLHGRPGVGKTQLVQQLADRIGGRLYDLRLTTIEPQDLRGLPYYDHEARKTTWYRPDDLPDDPDRPAVLFLDELTSASPYLQPTVYGLLQERRVGQHRLPESVFVVAAGNSVEDGAVAYEMNTALSDRLVHMRIVASAPDWLENFAAPHRLHPAVIAFIKTRPDLLETTEAALEAGQMIACTPRSWERVAQVCAAIPDRQQRNIMVAGIVGEAVAAEFATVADEVAATVQVTEMLAMDQRGRLAHYPSNLHGLTALVYGLVGALDEGSAAKIIEIMAEIRQLDRLSDDPGLRALPLGELATYGFETLIRRGLELGLADAFLASPAFRSYSEERKALGLV
ncbi:MAG: MoxR family ATPase [Pseudomonadota bacterium]